MTKEQRFKVNRVANEMNTLWQEVKGMYLKKVEEQEALDEAADAMSEGYDALVALLN